MRRLARRATRPASSGSSTSGRCSCPTGPATASPTRSATSSRTRTSRCIFVIPGVTDTFRVNGRATIVTDPELLEQCAVEGKVAEARSADRDRRGVHALLEGVPALEPLGSGGVRRPVRAAVVRRADALGQRGGRAGAVRRRARTSGTRAAKVSTDRVPLRRLRLRARPLGGGSRAVPRGAHPGRRVPRRGALRSHDRRTGPAPAAAGRGLRRAAAGRAGIGDGVFVVAYDHGGLRRGGAALVAAAALRARGRRSAARRLRRLARAGARRARRRSSRASSSRGRARATRSTRRS